MKQQSNIISSTNHFSNANYLQINAFLNFLINNVQTFINYIDKMNDQYGNLFDFQDLRRKTQQYCSSSSKHSSGSVPDFDLESNQQLMRSFKELRQKLKASNKENQMLRQQLKGTQVQLRQIQESENNLMAINHQLKEKIGHLNITNQELKKRIIILKDDQVAKSSIQQQVDYLKTYLIESKHKIEILQEEKRKLIEMSIEDKMNLQEKLSKLQFKKHSDDKYLCDLQSQLSKARQSSLKLQNELKKMQIKYDEQIFNKQWSKSNFQKEHYQKKIAELQNEVLESKSKNRRQKQKRAELQQRLLQLQSVTGMWNVKAEVYEGEVDVLAKKMKKMERRMSQAKQNVNKLACQKINWEERFNKSAQICQQLISRIKREVIGDMVELAKACEYKLNKIKDNKENQGFKNTTQIINSAKKSKTDKKNRKSIEKEKEKDFGQTPKYQFSFNRTQNSSQNTKILSQTDPNRRKIQNSKPSITDTQSNSIANRQNIDSLQGEYNNIEQKVRRQREQMQRKLKQKMMFRKIQVSSSPQKAKLREQYLKMAFDK